MGAPKEHPQGSTWSVLYLHIDRTVLVLVKFFMSISLWMNCAVKQKTTDYEAKKELIHDINTK